MIDFRNVGQFLALMAFTLALIGLGLISSGISIVFGEGAGYFFGGASFIGCAGIVAAVWRRLLHEMGDGDGE
ncbi:hypothetical protein [Adlercreutzia muris]|uniref:Uncharacterized protein n=1 Tax=Adlercreutzia muris TaxID=1796610 RepID=A0A7C8BQV0_9ACTN|nr:hypothetical protein [Adlercreutzia muris]KAB1647973.1 hypothetical protein F8D48_06685 [Adlercreutzia muris]MCR2027735.1 hypothetical protein [Adlercreutzia muris]